MMSVSILLAIVCVCGGGAVLFGRKTLFRCYCSPVVCEFLYVNFLWGHVSLIQLSSFLNLVVTLELHCTL